METYSPKRPVDSIVNANVRLLRRFLPLTVLFMCAWWPLDWLFAVQYRWVFLGLRLAACVLATSVVLTVVNRRAIVERDVFAAWWVFCLSWNLGIAPMLFFTSQNPGPYITGASIAMTAAGVYPIWPARFVVTNVLVQVALLIGAMLLGGASWPNLALGFVAFTSVALAAGIAAWFRYTGNDMLYRAHKALAKHAENRTRFFHNISHELRTPLTLIIGPTEQLLSEQNGDDEQRALLTIRNNAHRLLRLIDDLLAMAKSDRSHLELNTKVFDLAILAKRVVENASFAAAAGGRTLRLEDLVGNAFVKGDPHRLEMAITNLVGNALKYTRQGDEIVVACYRDGLSATLRVTDNGPGMDHATVGKIFERFAQGTSTEGGVGIGLSLVKEIVALHRGTVDVESEIGRGSSFWFSIPSTDAKDDAEWEEGSEVQTAISVRPSEAPIAIGSSLPSGDGDHTVLVVDDEDQVRAFVESLLSKHFKVVTAVDGVEGLEKCREIVPDLVLSDVMMPRLKGTDLVRKLKSDPNLLDIPVILMTAKGDADSESEAILAGADDYIHKPFHPRVMVARIELHIRLKLLSRVLARQENAAVLGTLTAGILHEINNPAHAIKQMGNLVSETAKPVLLEQARSVIVDGAARILSLTDAMRTHVRPGQDGGQEPFSIRESLDASVRLLKAAHKERYVISLDCDDAAMALGRAGEVNSVLLNLMDNAQKSGANTMGVRVETNGGQAVRIYFQDNGPGVPAEARKKIFSPFFTTREQGKGTGLGLYMGRQLIERSGGTLELLPSEHGALFRIELPAVTAISIRSERPVSVSRS